MTTLKIKKYSLLLAILLVCSVIFHSCKPDPVIVVNPPAIVTDSTYVPTVIPSTIEIGNPQRGYYQWNDYPYLSTMPRFDIYRRMSWRPLETAKDVYNFSSIDGYLETLKKGERFGLRIMCLSTSSSQYNGIDVPDYVVKEKMGWFNGKKYANSDSIFVPDWNNPDFLTRVEKLVQALGTKYDSDPRISWIEVGLYGNWGEFHTYPIEYPTAAGTYVNTGSTYIPAPLTLDPLNPTQRKYKEGTMDSKRRIFNAHVNAFPHKQLISLTADLQMLFEALAMTTTKPIGMRRDSWGKPDFADITMYESYKPTTAQWSIFNERWKTAPFFAENWGGIYTTESDMISQLEGYHTSGLAFGNFGVTNFTQLAADQQAGYAKCGRRIGYRYQISNVSVQLKDSTFNLSTSWKNINIAPTYENWQIQAYIVNAETSEMFSAPVTLNVNLRQLLSEVTPAIQNSISIAMKAGWKSQKQLQLRIIVKDPNDFLIPMYLDMTKRNTDGSYNLLNIGVFEGKAYLMK